MKRNLRKLSTKSVIIISFFLGVLMGGSVFFYVTYSPFTQASNQEIQFQAKAYEDLVRFKAEGSNISQVQVEIYDLSGRKIYGGETNSRSLDWYRTSDNGERLTKGTYLYVTKAFSTGGLVKTSGIGKMYINPDSIQLQSAPNLESNHPTTEKDNFTNEDQAISLQYDQIGNFTVEDSLGVGTENPERQLHLQGSNAVFRMDRDQDSSAFLLTRTAPDDFSTIWKTYVFGVRASGVSDGSFIIEDLENDVGGRGKIRFKIDDSGNVGIGTRNPGANLEVHGSDSNLLALYNPDSSTTSAKFRVENDGTVRADGTYYGADFVTGSGADVAERINTSEWVEKGDVVEVDPKHEGFFRRTKNSYSTRVAGVVSSNPGVVLGNDDEFSSDKWQDNRPVLALTGRVPVKANIENGSIVIGDLLVSAPQPGYAMKCSDRSKCTGAVIGKALEPLREGSGKIMAQVSLS